VILAQLVAGYSIAQLLILIVAVAACCGLVLIACRQFGVTIPPWVLQVLTIVAVAFIIIFAIRLISSM
jgi:hypothetical protein